MQGVDRTRRVAQAIAEELPAALREVKDPRVTGLITVHGVTVSRDLGVAKVRFDVLGGADVTAAAAGLHHAAGFLRSRLATALRLRRMPELRFELDPPSRIEDLLRRIGAEGGTA
ncbi:30S ribosome-binding factor RbfA [Immundisolibacter sp.]|jgi:ribosome-binding factor A|uniref:30S ribosome-binding factor RbfA n=1 Tax=Immundisolibacter sp. TaxID=1934948 RepID=UPI0019CE6CB1|nr:30S ribosome-binding factor RbfA [Immundisolibacter sp.]MBC7161349.1 30S ribosome-binding factor RbfA [Immundisolibacter sp.]MEA3219008.1 Ribosome-binding factor A [Immundisolibacter sp.]